ncbi:MAG: oligosaccharide flippase family protein [Dissulfurispiraceae bacterium]|jgi:O-antigen/teichoic acid export membrane protein
MARDSEPIFEIDADAEPMPVPELDVVMEPQPVAAPAAVETKKPSMLFLVGSLVGGNFVSMMLRMVGGVLQARCVLPAVLGMFNGIGLVLGYAPFLQLGILNGINRELPYFIGKGDRQRVNELAAAAQAWALAIGGIVGIALSGVGCWQLAHGQWQLAAGWFTNAVLGVLLFYNTNYLQMTYRTSHDFARLAMSSVIENTVALVLVALVALLNFYGLCLRALLTTFVSVTFLYYWRPVRVGPHWNWRHLKHLLVIGAPIFIVGQIYAWWTVLDSTLVLSYMGKQGLGLYAMVLVVVTTLDMLPLSLSQVVYPRMAEQFGRTENVRDLIRITRKPIMITVAGMIPIIAFSWLIVEPVMRIVLPKYVAAVPAMKWSLLIPFVSSFQPINNLFNVLRRQDLYIVAIVLGMGAYVGSLMWLVRNGAELTAFPQAMFIGRMVYIFLSYVLIVFLVRKQPKTK